MDELSVEQKKELDMLKLNYMFDRELLEKNKTNIFFVWILIGFLFYGITDFIYHNRNIFWMGSWSLIFSGLFSVFCIEIIIWRRNIIYYNKSDNKTGMKQEPNQYKFMLNALLMTVITTAVWYFIFNIILFNLNMFGWHTASQNMGGKNDRKS